MTMFKMNTDAKNSRPWILQYIPDGILLTVKRYVVHQISMTSMWQLLILLVKEVSTRIYFAHTLKIQIKHFPNLTTGLYGHSVLG